MEPWEVFSDLFHLLIFGCMYDSVCIGMRECGHTCAMAHVEVRGQAWVSIVSFNLLWGKASYLLFIVALLQGLLLSSPHCPVEVVWEHRLFQCIFFYVGFGVCTQVKSLSSKVFIHWSISPASSELLWQCRLSSLILTFTLYSFSEYSSIFCTVRFLVLGIWYVRLDRWQHLITNLWREMVKPIWQISKPRLTKQILEFHHCGPSVCHEATTLKLASGKRILSILLYFFCIIWRAYL